MLHAQIHNLLRRFQRFIVSAKISLWTGIITLIVAATAMHPLAGIIVLPILVILLYLFRLFSMIEGEARVQADQN